MKIPILLILFIYISSLIFAQPPSIEWQKSFGGSDIDKPTSILQTKDGGYIICGITLSKDGDVIGNHGTGKLGYDIWIIKINLNGQLQWQKCLGGTKIDIANSIIELKEGGYLIAGLTYSDDGDISSNKGSSDYWIIKIDLSGQIVWQKCYGGSENDMAYSIIEAKDGNFIILGESLSEDGDVKINYRGDDIWILKINPKGDILWQKSLITTNHSISSSMIETTDGNYLLVGTTIIDNLNTDYYVAKLNQNGQIIWEKSFGGISNDKASSAVETDDGNYLIVGFTDSGDGDVTGYHGNTDMWIIKINSSGKLLWQKCYGGTTIDVAKCVVKADDGGFIIAGYTQSSNGDVNGLHGNYNYDTWLIKIDREGKLIWQKCLGGSESEYAYSMIRTSDGGSILACSSTSNDGDVSMNYGWQDFWIIKLSPETAVNESNSQQETFIQVIPNPSSNLVTFKIQDLFLDNKLIIYDAFGRMLYSMVNIDNNAISVDVSGFSSGIYLVTIGSYRKMFIVNR